MIRAARACVAFALAATLGGDVVASGGGIRPAWSEVRWPFLMDQWGVGRAFLCVAGHCGTEVSLYLRTKVGFCNCSTGVADDDEIDRVGDMELISGRSLAQEPGQAVTIGAMKGRARVYRVESAFEPRRIVLAVALANKCDAVVATVVGVQTLDLAQLRAAIDFLSGKDILRWVEANSGQATTGQGGTSQQ